MDPDENKFIKQVELSKSIINEEQINKRKKEK